MTDPIYEMRLNLNVLEHLGINLYSNVPSVLAEVVANSWDADATVVDVKFDATKDTIVIQDNGEGMDFEDVNSKFLKVGYRRRENQPGKTKKNRSPMGRKGIGKLSLFSIAKHITVETAKSGNANAFEMRIEDIRQKIGEETDCYYPIAVPTKNIDFERGTRITLSGLKKKQTFSAVDGLRKRLARRFSIIGSKNDFSVNIDGVAVIPSDRGYYDKLQYIWTYGGTVSAQIDCPNVICSEDRSSSIEENNIAFHGWLGTVARSNQLKDDSGENLNRIAIFVRGKMAQEDILGDFNEQGVYASYLVGELHVDDLDQYDGAGSIRDEDAATSSRQKIVEDDPRYEKIRGAVAKELKHIQRSWAEHRSKEGTREALEIPVINDWVKALPKHLKPRAKRWLGKINQIRFDGEMERQQLWKHAILAFEFYSWGRNLEQLETIDDSNMEGAIKLFNEVDDFERTLYGEIVQQRVEVIRTLQYKVENNARENLIQKYIFDHLWLLDPSWERVQNTQYMETRIETILNASSDALTSAEKLGRIDIAYRKTAGKHVVIELKRPGTKVKVYELADQIRKYRDGILKVLASTKQDSEPLEIICVLGEPPIEWDSIGGRDTVRKALDSVDARYVNYSELLNNAYKAYSDYFEKERKLARLSSVIKEINNFAPKQNGSPSSGLSSE